MYVRGVSAGVDRLRGRAACYALYLRQCGYDSDEAAVLVGNRYPRLRVGGSNSGDASSRHDGTLNPWLAHLAKQKQHGDAWTQSVQQERSAGAPGGGEAPEKAAAGPRS